MTRVYATLCMLAVVAGCESPPPPDAPAAHEPVIEAQDSRGTYDHMVDAAMLADMTVSDHHFLPHRARLSPTGERRLLRLADLMEAHGGTLRFNTRLTDEELIAARARVVVDFLAQRGIDTTTDVLEPAMAGGEGMEAREAILIKAGEGMYRPSGRTQSPTP